MITVVIPHIEVPARGAMLQQAIDSVYAQTANQYVRDPIVITDHNRRGAAWSVAHGVNMVQTEWLTLLGDDDWLMPNHHEVLMRAQQESGADVVYGRPLIVREDGSTHPCWNIEYDADLMRRTSIIPGGGSLIRTELLQRVGVPQIDDAKYGRETRQYDDWGMYLALLDGGARFHHIADELYCWRHWSGNTSGKGNR